MSAVLPFAIPPRPATARQVRDTRMPWPDATALQRVAEMAREQAQGLHCPNTRLALTALADAMEHWRDDHTLAMGEALDMFAILWRSRERGQ